MVYADKPEEFSIRMVSFIKTTRDLIEQHNGLFDKFTGDGFIVYFNETICSDANNNYIDCFLSFIKSEIKFADINDHLIAVGDAIVWASRMSSVAAANEIVINNLLFNSIKIKDNISFESFQYKTKYGESFMANKLLFNN